MKKRKTWGLKAQFIQYLEEHADEKLEFNTAIEESTGRTDLTVKAYLRKSLWDIRRRIESNGHTLCVGRETYDRNGPVIHLAAISYSKPIPYDMRPMLRVDLRHRCEQREAYGAQSDRMLEHLNRLPSGKAVIARSVEPDLKFISGVNRQEAKQLRLLLEDQKP